MIPWPGRGAANIQLAVGHEWPPPLPGTPEAPRQHQIQYERPCHYEWRVRTKPV